MTIQGNAEAGPRAGTGTAFMVVGLTLVFVVGVGFGLFSRPIHAAETHLVRHAAPELTQDLPENLAGEVRILSDASLFDLRTWRPFAPEQRREPVSPVNYTNYLRVLKLKPCGYLYAHYGTSGLRIDGECLTHPYRFLEKQHPPKDVHWAEGGTEYALAVDISREPVGVPFPVVVEATYWNGFEDQTAGDASTYTDDAGPLPDDLSVTVLLPANKPCKSVRLDNSPSSDSKWAPYADQTEAYRSPDGECVSWSIRRKQPATHYRLAWRW